MDDGSQPKFVNVDRYIIVEKKLSRLFLVERVPYLLVPADVRKALKEEYNIDIIEDRDMLKIDLVFGEEEDRNGVAPKLVYTIKKLEEPTFTGKYVGKTRAWRR